MAPPPPSSRSWSIHGRSEITQRYEILERIGYGAYADVYRARRRSDGVVVALKEIHDYQSSFREIEALQILRDSPNVVDLLEYFWQEEEDAVLVLEFLPADLGSVIRDAKMGGGIAVGEVKQWMLQILRGVGACHRNAVVHRDLKPSNLLISAEGILKLADFGQSRILEETRFVSTEGSPYQQGSENEAWMLQQPAMVRKGNQPWLDGPENQNSETRFVSTEGSPHQQGSENEAWMLQQPAMVREGNQPWLDGPENQNSLEPRPTNEDEYLWELDGHKANYATEDTDKEMSLQDCDASCLATCSTGDVEDDPFKGSYTYEVEEVKEDDESGVLTSCVGTRWFRAPELLYGSTNYGLEIDLWSLGCIFAELLSFEPLFPGTSDIDQLGKIISILGDLTEETWTGCSKLPDYNKIFFSKVENPIGLEACLPNRSAAEVNLVGRLLCYDPASRAAAMELLQDRYFAEEPLPVPVNELRVPSTKDGHDESSPGERADYRDLGSDSDIDEFGSMHVTTTEKGFSIRFS